MALVKSVLKNSLFVGLQRIFLEQSDKASTGSEDEEPSAVIQHISEEMSKVIADAVDAYIKSGDITVGPGNIQVTSAAPGSPAAVAPLQPAKMQ